VAEGISFYKKNYNFTKIFFMKLCALLLLLFTTPCFAQKVPAGQKTIDAGKPAALDSATYNFLFPVIKMIQVAEDTGNRSFRDRLLPGPLFFWQF